jgi:hypothetical protein
MVYEMSDHGCLFYLTRWEYWLFHAMVWGGWSLGALAAVLNYRWRVIKNLRRDGWRYPT